MGRFKNRRPGKTGRTRGMGRSIRHESDEAQRGYPSGDPPTSVHLRRLRAETALDKLEREVALARARGERELLIVHGKGMGSETGPVLGDLTRRWIREHPEAVASWRPAPRDWGGEGALVIVLKKGNG